MVLNRQLPMQSDLQNAVFLPLLAMVLLTFIVWARMYVVRIGTAIKRKIPTEQFRLDNPELPAVVVESGDNWRNLFEAPTLFYVFCLSAFVLGMVDKQLLMLAWTYVALRYVHSFIHVSYNKILHRFSIYFISCLILWYLWARLAWQLLGATTT